MAVLKLWTYTTKMEIELESGFCNRRWERSLSFSERSIFLKNVVEKWTYRRDSGFKLYVDQDKSGNVSFMCGWNDSTRCVGADDPFFFLSNFLSTEYVLQPSEFQTEKITEIQSDGVPLYFSDMRYKYSMMPSLNDTCVISHGDKMPMSDITSETKPMNSACQKIVDLVLGTKHSDFEKFKSFVDSKMLYENYPQVRAQLEKLIADVIEKEYPKEANDIAKNQEILEKNAYLLRQLQNEREDFARLKKANEATEKLEKEKFELAMKIKYEDSINLMRETMRAAGEEAIRLQLATASENVFLKEKVAYLAAMSSGETARVDKMFESLKDMCEKVATANAAAGSFKVVKVEKE